MSRRRDSGRGRGRRERRIRGRLAVTRSGLGYVDTDQGPGTPVEQEDLGDALHGDEVEIKLVRRRGRGGKQHGVVVQVLERRERRLSGRVVLSSGERHLRPVDRRYPVAPLKGELPEELGADDRAVVLIPGGRTPGRPRYLFLEALSSGLDPRQDVTDVAHEIGLSLAFPPGVVAHAHSRAELSLDSDTEPPRRDLRSRHTFTIDPESAQDFDDALSWRELDDGRAELGIHIADVSFYVEIGDPVDDEGLERATSVYLPGLTLPMLPDSLSGDKASLAPRVDRAAVSILVTVDATGEVEDWELCRSVLQSGHRLTYAEAQAILDAPSSHPVGPALTSIQGVTLPMRAARLSRGLDLAVPEFGVELDDGGMPTGFPERTQGPAHHLIEECMLLANQLVGGWALAAHLPIIYRVHEKPQWERLLELGLVLEEVGIRSSGRDLSRPRELARVLDEAEERKLRSLVSTHLLRALEKARYSAEDVGHYGLGMRGYCHFTSPIRRYPDLHTHRVVLAAASALGSCTGASRASADADRLLGRVRRRFSRDVVALAEQSSARELMAQRAERLSLRVKALRALESRLGDTMAGMVSTVMAGGFFVQLDDVPIDGFVSRDWLPRARYRLGPRGQSFEAEGAPGFGLGQRVEVRIEAVSIERRELDLALLGSGAGGVKRARGKGGNHRS